ncbi:zinc finger protein with KRAB and SCAN domains 5-like isoform X2 [Pararge aegeria]|uniref:zinc finger protein with KRAB and SCAN domains 5-like isoform X2 n=1 Tax=Pararge aegeria TaxID=116150 RepID=UPI0019D2BE12|nr:zinc finger protein with KRAB and SCAN domains 5-like isoform X2 [Pararge aegeria]
MEGIRILVGMRSDEESEMNFAAFQAVAGPGTHFVTTGGQMPKMQQNMTNNGTSLSQVVGMVGGVNMGDGVQYVRTIDGSSQQGTPQLISVPVTLPGAKPGDPQSIVQIQVLSPNVLQQQQPKYQMQIPIQGFQQGGTVLTLAYSPDANDSGAFQIIGNTLPEGLQVLAAMPQEMQLIHPQQAQENKDQVQQAIQHQVFITPNNQIIINGPDVKSQMTNNNPEITNIIIKEECDENDDESSQGTETNEGVPSWLPASSTQDLVKYLNTLPPQQNLEVMQMLLQQTQTLPLPLSLQQFLKHNPAEVKRSEVAIDVEMTTDNDKSDLLIERNTETVMDEDGNTTIQKKKKKYKKKPKAARPRPGQVNITVAADGTPMYCCPECNMAYIEKEQLEMHLSVHKIERRFICGICGAGLKRKEHLERHKLGHNPERPYVCGVCGKGFKRREHLNLHAVIHSGVKTEMCGQCGKGFYRKDHLRKHTRSHEYKTARTHHEGTTDTKTAQTANPTNNNVATNITANSNTILPEITIHVPTSSNLQMPVQINIPQHVMTSLAAAQASASTVQHDNNDAHAQLDALLAQHT